jgi:hypothetical protein
MNAWLCILIDEVSSRSSFLCIRLYIPPQHQPTLQPRIVRGSYFTLSWHIWRLTVMMQNNKLRGNSRCRLTLRPEMHSCFLVHSPFSSRHHEINTGQRCYEDRLSRKISLVHLGCWVLQRMESRVEGSSEVWSNCFKCPSVCEPCQFQICRMHCYSSVVALDLRISTDRRHHCRVRTLDECLLLVVYSL